MKAVIMDNELKGVIAVVELNERTEENPFSTGSTGFHGQGKIDIDGVAYQINFMLIKIGSKYLSESFSADLSKRVRESIH